MRALTLRRSVVAAAAIAAALAAAVCRRPPTPAPPPAPREASREPPTVAPSRAGAEIRSTTAASPAPPAADDRQAMRFERVSRAMDLLRFPQDSQPLLPTMRDVLHPNGRSEGVLPLSVATGAPAGDLSYRFTANAYGAIGDAPITVTLEAFRGKDAQRHAPLTVRACELARAAQPDFRTVATGLPLNDEGREGDPVAGDGVYAMTLSFAHFTELAEHAGFARVDVDFLVDGSPAPAHASLDFRVTPAAPAVFDGVAGERLTADGLAIDVALHVLRPGRYFLQGLLFDANDRPIGMAVARPTLATGVAVVPLLYWGLLFREANAKAPFTFRTLTGHRMPEGQEPDRTDIATWDGSYETRAYAPGDFSDKEYESPSKERKLRALADLAMRPR